jgi:hypothetical protein
MKSLMYATACMVALCGPAHALIPTDSLAEDIALAKSYIQDLKNYAAQLQQLQQAVQQVEWATREFNALVANPNLANAMGLLQVLGIQNPLPVSPYAVQALITGQGGISGTLGTLSTFANSSATTNRVYVCNDGTVACQSATASANGIAGSQGIAAQVYSQMSAHFPLLASLQKDMLAATTPAERESVAGQIAAEQAWAMQASGQLQTAQIMLMSQQDNRTQQADERISQSFHSQLDQARAEGIIQ